MGHWLLRLSVRLASVSSNASSISKQAVTRKHSRDSKHLPKQLLVNSEHRLSTSPHLKCDVSSVICVCQEQLTTTIKLMVMRIDEWRHLAIIYENYHVPTVLLMFCCAVLNGVKMDSNPHRLKLQIKPSFFHINRENLRAIFGQ